MTARRTVAIMRTDGARLDSVVLIGTKLQRPRAIAGHVCRYLAASRIKTGWHCVYEADPWTVCRQLQGTIGARGVRVEYIGNDFRADPLEHWQRQWSVGAHREGCRTVRHWHDLEAAEAAGFAVAHDDGAGDEPYGDIPF